MSSLRRLSWPKASSRGRNSVSAQPAKIHPRAHPPGPLRFALAACTAKCMANRDGSDMVAFQLHKPEAVVEASPSGSGSAAELEVRLKHGPASRDQTEQPHVTEQLKLNVQVPVASPLTAEPQAAENTEPAIQPKSKKVSPLSSSHCKQKYGSKPASEQASKQASKQGRNRASTSKHASRTGAWRQAKGKKQTHLKARRQTSNVQSARLPGPLGRDAGEGQGGPHNFAEGSPFPGVDTREDKLAKQEEGAS